MVAASAAGVVQLGLTGLAEHPPADAVLAVEEGVPAAAGAEADDAGAAGKAQVGMLVGGPDGDFP